MPEYTVRPTELAVSCAGREVGWARDELMAPPRWEVHFCIPNDDPVLFAAPSRDTAIDLLIALDVVSRMYGETPNA